VPWWHLNPLLLRDERKSTSRMRHRLLNEYTVLNNFRTELHRDTVESWPSFEDQKRFSFINPIRFCGTPTELGLLLRSAFLMFSGACTTAKAPYRILFHNNLFCRYLTERLWSQYPRTPKADEGPFISHWTFSEQHFVTCSKSVNVVTFVPASV